MMSEKIRRYHLDRKAILYVRQSSAHQVLHNWESGALQYAMRDPLIARSRRSTTISAARRQAASSAPASIGS
jgi:hypothetical protein